MSRIPVVAFGTANAVKGRITEGFADGVSLTVIKTTSTQQPYRLLRSAGEPWTVGEWLEIASDQSGRSLGGFRVVGSWTPDTGELVGEVPNKSLPMWHCK